MWTNDNGNAKWVETPEDQDRRDRAMNIAANGRWGMLGMGAIALHQGLVLFAFAFILTLLIAYVLEQLPGRAIRLAGLAMTAWGLVLILAFAAALLA